MDIIQTRKILAYKLNSNINDPDKGFIKPLIEIGIDNNLIELTQENFCDSGKIFITTAYDHIEQAYKSFELFEIEVSKSNVENGLCKYVSAGFKASRLRPRDYVEILFSEDIPDSNAKTIFLHMDRPPLTEYIFIRTKNHECYGPFKWSIENNTLKLEIITTSLPGPTLPPSNIFKVELKTIEGYCKYLKNSDILIITDLISVNNKARFYDYSSDEDVVRLFSKIAKDLNFNTKKMELVSLEAQVKKLPKINTKIVQEKLIRLNEIVEDNYTLTDEITQGFNKFLRNSVLGDKIVSDFVEKNSTKYISNIIEQEKEKIDAELASRTNEFISYNSKIETAKAELRDLNYKIEQKKEEASKNTFEIDKIHAEELNLQLSDKYNELKKLESEIEVMQQKYAEFNTLEKLREEIKFTEKSLDKEKDKQYALSRSMDALRKEFNSTDEELRHKLLTQRSYIDTLNSLYIKEPEKTDLDIFKPISTFNYSDKVTGQNQLIQYLLNKFKENNRYLSSVDLINLLISTQQSFITFLAGLPGVGKTSLSRLFVKAQNIENRLVEVSVSRGWSSQKDFIGYHNPLTNTFQSANTGLYDFLKLLDIECKNAEKHPMAYILLDEANLSPIEHYWSSFIGLTDNFSGQEIIIGSNKVRIPKYMRFIATINYDSTTEPLSPRIIDRAPIIVLENEGINNVEISEEISEIIHSLPISEETMNDLFGNSNTVPELLTNEQVIFDSIKNILSKPLVDLGRPINISPRKEQAIRQYCDKARAIMTAETDGGDLVALDYAILQHVLPQVRGTGSKFAKRLTDLNNILISHKLEKSHAYVDRMLSYGAQDLNTYDFFCW